MNRSDAWGLNLIQPINSQPTVASSRDGFLTFRPSKIFRVPAAVSLSTSLASEASGFGSSQANGSEGEAISGGFGMPEELDDAPEPSKWSLWPAGWESLSIKSSTTIFSTRTSRSSLPLVSLVTWSSSLPLSTCYCKNGFLFFDPWEDMPKRLNFREPNGIIWDLLSDPHPIMKPDRGGYPFSLTQVMKEMLHKAALNRLTRMVASIAEGHFEVCAISWQHRREVMVSQILNFPKEGRETPPWHVPLLMREGQCTTSICVEQSQRQMFC